MKSFLASLLLAFTCCAQAVAQVTAPDSTRQEDVIYGRKFGTALTMDVFTPKQHPNGAAVVLVVSGGWFSDHGSIEGTLPYRNALVKHGYTVFAVVHGSQPKYTIPEVLLDMNRALRYIRFHAKDFKIDPNKIGITGGSAGGHLSLMQGVTGDDGIPNAPDPVDRTSCKVQAVACFFPPTDFLNYGAAGVEAIGAGVLKDFYAPFQFIKWDAVKKCLTVITDMPTIRAITMQISPIYHASATTPPTLILHGDADPLVPIQQSKIFIAKLQELKVPSQLIVKPGAGHGWGNGLDEDMNKIADWFDKYLKPGH